MGLMKPEGVIALLGEKCYLFFSPFTWYERMISSNMKPSFPKLWKRAPVVLSPVLGKWMKHKRWSGSINTNKFFNYDLWPFDSLTNLRVSIKHTLNFSSKWVYTTRIKAELCYLILMWTFNSLKNVPTEFPYFQTQQKMWLGEDGDICGLLQKSIANY